MEKRMQTMDGNEACAYASYAFTEVAAIYPITPSSPMAEATDRWSAQGRKNIFGHPVKLVEMQSEAGAISVVHGALDSGALATSFTSSQGLMLMIPTMFRIAGQLKPAVLHVASRNVATNNISIFAEHSDVMATRQTGFAFLCSSSVQQAMDMAAVAHLSAIKGHVPFLHFFDGFRTSHEIQKVELLDYDELAKLVDHEELEKFRREAQNPEHPRTRTSGLNDDTYFQAREAMNPYYDNLPAVVKDSMAKISALTGRDYRLFNYYGAPDAKYVLVGMGSVMGTAEETVDYLNAHGGRYGYVEVHLFRPFSIDDFVQALPRTVKAVTVLDRDKEPGAVGEPLYEEVASVMKERQPSVDVYACRFGLACKDTTPAQIKAMFENMLSDRPANHYTIGIDDDLTHRSIPYGPELDIIPSDTVSCKFWGLGGDGTVGANKNSIKIIGDHTAMNVQAYFEYDGKKSGGVTRSHLRFGSSPIRASYLVKKADFVACHNKAYIGRYDLVRDLKDGGSLLLATDWGRDEVESRLPDGMKKALADKHIRLYIIDSEKIAGELGLGSRTNTILQAAFFKIAGIIPVDQAVEYMKAAALKSYGKKGEAVVEMNYRAIERGVADVIEVQVPGSWTDIVVRDAADGSGSKPHFIRKILEPVNSMNGDGIPVSDFVPYADGSFPCQTSAWEKRGIAVKVPHWDASKCIQCNQCSYVCPHASIRPYLVREEEIETSPVALEAVAAKGLGDNAEGYRFTMGVSVLDCQGCGSCANVCPVKALEMVPLAQERDEADAYAYLASLPERNPYGTTSVKGSQFNQPLLEFSGACAGCGETPYAKLVTQLYGPRMYVATATGCSQVWATSFPSFPYSTNAKGEGPAVSGSLFENNAEFGMGLYLGSTTARSYLLEKVKTLAATTGDEDLRKAALEWIDGYDSKDRTVYLSQNLKDAVDRSDDHSGEAEYLRTHEDQLTKKSVWMFGGDGWAYDIGYGGLDHVVASGNDVNIMVFDTEVYSNTGGQASKSTPSSAVAQFAAAGKRTKKKDLGMMLMGYKDIYVAQVAMGASPAQLLKAVQEAESYDGPSVIICYSPCINHGLKCGMGDVMGEMKRAVDVGYWQLYRYDPRLEAQGRNPFQLDSKAPSGDFRGFLMGEVRYASLSKISPDEADALYAKCEKEAMDRYAGYAKRAKEEV